jgi:hypothetical protein
MTQIPGPLPGVSFTWDDADFLARSGVVQRWELDNHALKWIRDRHESPPGVPTAVFVDITHQDPLPIGKLFRPLGKGELYDWTRNAQGEYETQPWSWRRMLAGLPARYHMPVFGQAYHIPNPDPIVQIGLTYGDQSYDHARLHCARKHGQQMHPKAPVWDMYVRRESGAWIKFHPRSSSRAYGIVSFQKGHVTEPPRSGPGGSDGHGTFKQKTDHYVVPNADGVVPGGVPSAPMPTPTVSAPVPPPPPEDPGDNVPFLQPPRPPLPRNPHPDDAGPQDNARRAPPPEAPQQAGQAGWWWKGHYHPAGEQVAQPASRSSASSHPVGLAAPFVQPIDASRAGSSTDRIGSAVPVGAVPPPSRPVPRPAGPEPGAQLSSPPMAATPVQVAAAQSPARPVPRPAGQEPVQVAADRKPTRPVPRPADEEPGVALSGLSLGAEAPRPSPSGIPAAPVGATELPTPVPPPAAPDPAVESSRPAAGGDEAAPAPASASDPIGSSPERKWTMIDVQLNLPVPAEIKEKLEQEYKAAGLLPYQKPAEALGGASASAPAKVVHPYPAPYSLATPAAAVSAKAAAVSAKAGEAGLAASASAETASASASVEAEATAEEPAPPLVASASVEAPLVASASVGAASVSASVKAEATAEEPAPPLVASASVEAEATPSVEAAGTSLDAEMDGIAAGRSQADAPSRWASPAATAAPRAASAAARLRPRPLQAEGHGWNHSSSGWGAASDWGQSGWSRQACEAGGRPWDHSGWTGGNGQASTWSGEAGAARSWLDSSALVGAERQDTSADSNAWKNWRGIHRLPTPPRGPRSPSPAGGWGWWTR